MKDIEQRVKIKDCVKLGKTFSETHKIMRNTYRDKCMGRSRIHKWFSRFKEGREDINDDRRGTSRCVITKEVIESVRDFIMENPRASLCLMEKEFNISRATIHRILTQHLGLQKEKQNRELSYSIVDDGETQKHHVWINLDRYDTKKKRPKPEWKYAT